MANAPALTVQVVLYQTRLDQVWRQLLGVCQAARRALEEGAAGEVELAYGDCSDDACLADADVADLRRAAIDGGLSGLSYRFFGANLGSAGGSNRLAAAGRSQFLLVLNPDTYPDPRLLVALLHAAAPPRVGAVDARQIPCEHPKAFDPASGDTSWVSGAAMLVRRAAFDAVGGFAADTFPLYGDDVDLSWRLRLAGWRTVHEPSALVFHDKRPTAGGVDPQPSERYWASLARLLLCRRWGRPDLEAETETFLARQPRGPHREALEEYRRRREQGRLPAPLAGAERVAQFVAGNYAVHRF